MKNLILFLLSYFSFFNTSFSQVSDITVNNYQIEAALLPSKKALEVQLVCNISPNKDTNTIQFLFSSEAILKFLLLLMEKIRCY